MGPITLIMAVFGISTVGPLANQLPAKSIFLKQSWRFNASLLIFTCCYPIVSCLTNGSKREEEKEKQLEKEEMDDEKNEIEESKTQTGENQDKTLNEQTDKMNTIFIVALCSIFMIIWLQCSMWSYLHTT